MRVCLHWKYSVPCCLAMLIAAQPASAQDGGQPAPAQTGGQASQDAPAPAANQAPATSQAPAAAQDTAHEGPLQDIVVTAQRRAENVQDIPLSIVAESGQNLRERGVTDAVSLGNRLSNVNINVVQNVVRINIRGIGSNSVTANSEGSVAFHVDGVYVTRLEAQSAGFFDIDRIEVLRGPQGTLYGRNATGGAVNLITRNPTNSLDGYAQLTIGNYGTVLTEGAIGGPLAPGLSARIAFQTSNHEGYSHQLFDPNGVSESGIDDLNTRAVRGKLRFEPAANLSFILEGDYFHQDDSSGYLEFIRPGDAGGPNLAVTLGHGRPTASLRDQTADFPNTTRKDNWGTSLTGEWNPAEHINLTSITAYRNYRYRYFMDYDQTNADGALFGADSQSESFSQELRASGTIGRFRYVVGAYYLWSSLDYIQASTRNRFYFGGPDIPVNGGYNTGTTDNVAWAGFGQLSYEITDWLGVDAGIRYSWERQNKINERLSTDFNTPLNLDGPHNFTTNIPFAHVAYDAWTPHFAVRITPLEDVMLYASYSRGFKSGGFTIGGGTAPPFAPEELSAYEVGLRSQLLGHRLQFNVSAFYYDYSNLQVRRATETGASVLESAGAATAKGIEAQLVAVPVDDLRLNVDVGLLKTRYDDYTTTDGLRPTLGILDLAGNHFVDSPPYRVNVGLEYAFHPSWGDVTLRGEGRFTGRTYFTPFNTLPFSQPAYDVFDVYLNYTSPNHLWSGGLYVRNIENDTVLSSGLGASQNIGAYVQGTLLPPRTFGIRIARQF